MTVGRTSFRHGRRPPPVGFSVGGIVAGYLPTVGTAPYLVLGARRMVSGYSGDLFILRNSTGSTQNFACATGSDYPDYTAITTFAAGNAVTITTIFDQSGNSRNAVQTTLANQPVFSLTEANAGRPPMLWDSDHVTPAATQNKFMNVTGISLSAQAVSLFDGIAPYSSAALNTYLWIKNGTTSVARMGLQAPTTSIGLGFGGVYSGGGGIPRVNLSTVGCSSSASALKLYCREVEFTLAAVASGTGNILHLGNPDGSETFNSRLSRWGTVAYAAALSTIDSTSVRDAITSMFSVPTVFTRRIVDDGDSLTEGSFLPTFLRNREYYEALNFNAGTEFFNIGIHGSGIANKVTLQAGLVQPLFTNAYGAGKCAYTLAIGINDLGVIATTGAGEYTAVSNYITTVKGYGFKVGVATCLPQDSSGIYADTSVNINGKRVIYNSSIVSGLAGGDYLIDQAANATLGVYPTSPDNAAFYASDKLHLLSTGYAINGPIFATAANSNV